MKMEKKELFADVNSISNLNASKKQKKMVTMRLELTTLASQILRLLAPLIIELAIKTGRRIYEIIYRANQLCHATYCGICYLLFN